MLVLGLDTSTAATGAAVVDDGRVLATATELAPNRHGELLAPLLARVLAESGTDRRDIGLVAAGVGPGPFTGLRVGMMSAAAFADALGLGVVGVCSLDAIAHAVDRPWAEGFAVMTDARRHEVYWAAYDVDARVSGPSVDRPADVAARLRAGSTVAGAGALLHRDVLDGVVVDDRAAYPDPAVIARLGCDDRWRVPFEPMYLRRPDARPPGRPKRVTPA